MCATMPYIVDVRGSVVVVVVGRLVRAFVRACVRNNFDHRCSVPSARYARCSSVVCLLCVVVALLVMIV